MFCYNCVLAVELSVICDLLRFFLQQYEFFLATVVVDGSVLLNSALKNKSSPRPEKRNGRESETQSQSRHKLG